MNHFATPGFWFHYQQLPTEIQELANKNFAVLQQDPHHPSLRLKRIDSYWSGGVVWIGPHGEYKRLLKG